MIFIFDKLSAFFYVAISLFSVHVSADVCNGVYLNGQLALSRTLFHCASNMADSFQPLTHLVQYENINLEVKAGFILNNLVSLNELENTVTFDCFFRLWWTDERWVGLLLLVVSVLVLLI